MFDVLRFGCASGVEFRQEETWTLQQENETQPAVLPKSWRSRVLPWGPNSEPFKLCKSAKALQLVGEGLQQEPTYRLNKEEKELFGEIVGAAPEVTSPGKAARLAWALGALLQPKAKTQEALLDYWFQVHGAVQATKLFLEILNLCRELREAGRRTYDFEEPNFFHLRRLLAGCGEAEYSDCKEMALSTRIDLEGRLASSLVFPDEDWVEQDADNSYNTHWLLASVRSLELAERLLRTQNLHAFWKGGMPIKATFLANVGSGIAPVLVDCLKADRHWGTTILKLTAECLACLPHPLAADCLLARMKNRHFAAAAEVAATNFPDLLLSRKAPNPPAKALLERLGGGTSVSPSQPTAASLPPILISPPWLSKKTKVATVPGLVAPDCSPVMRWGEERESWGFEVEQERPREEWLEALEKARNKEYFPVHIILQAPSDLARQALDIWDPEDDWTTPHHLPKVIARWELEARVSVLRLARKSLKRAVPFFLPFGHPDFAPLVTEALAKSGTRESAEAWLRRHSRLAATVLLPVALSGKGKARNHAVEGLRFLWKEERQELEEVAESVYGAPTLAAVKELFAGDPLLDFPKRLPKLPSFFCPAQLPRPQLADGSGALSEQAMENLGLMLAISSPEKPYAGLEIVKKACCPESLAQFAWQLFENWVAAGAPAKQRWAYFGLGWLGHEACLQRLLPLLEKWRGSGNQARAVLGLDVLLAHPSGLEKVLSISQNRGLKSLASGARVRILEAAERRGLTSEQLADRLVPDLGLSKEGCLTLEFGSRWFKVVLDENLAPVLFDQEGQQLKSLPKPGKKDDAALAGAAHQRFKTLKSEAKKSLSIQIRRLELAMSSERRWTSLDFEEYLIGHPLMLLLARRLVWGEFEGDRLLTAFRVAEDRSYADAEDQRFELSEGGRIGIVHPLALSAQELARWDELFQDYEILQPFAQLARATYHLDPEAWWSEHGGSEVATAGILSLEQRDWTRGPVEDGGMTRRNFKDSPGGRIYLKMDPGLCAGAPMSYETQTLSGLWLGSSEQTSFEGLSSVEKSELVRDLEGLRGQ